MSNFYIGVGGTGAKLMQTLIHLSAAGLLPGNRKLDCLLVDPDQANGTVDDTQQLRNSYAACQRLETGATDIFSRVVDLAGEPWTPVRRADFDTLNQIFDYSGVKATKPIETDLLELMFDPVEREMQVEQGFRGRPAIGSTILTNAIDFEDPTGVWHKLCNKIRAQAEHESVGVLLAGSVFGGSGAAGMPTILRLMKEELADLGDKLRLGLILFLPYFRFEKIQGEKVQADPTAFPTATAEALKYYHERGFLDLCDSVYTLGEKVSSVLSVSAVGARDQRNEPHFLELVGGFGATRFFGPKASRGAMNSLSVAAREVENTLTWSDLPAAPEQQKAQVQQMQKMIAFAVAYRYRFYPNIASELDKSGESKVPYLSHHIFGENVPKAEARAETAAVYDYVNRFLTWLMWVSLPREGFVPGLVNLNVFAAKQGNGKWQLRQDLENDRAYESLFNGIGKLKSLKKSFEDAQEPVTDVQAHGTGRLIRAIYDSCGFN